ncbi:MAG: STAS domain-containing protein [Acidobacteriales bacterium]|nr:STAS domain-containing protein [Terriglobales bacterium]
MQVSRRESGPVTVLELDGRLDSHTSEVLETALSESWARGATRIVLDCERLRYVSSAGLQVLLVAGQLAESKSGRIVFCRLRRNLGEIFEMTKFDAIFSVYASAEEALESF